METAFEKSSDKSRTLLFGLLVNCIFSDDAQGKCPLWERRNNLSIENKYDYVMELGLKEINSILVQHEQCYQKRLAGLMQE